MEPPPGIAFTDEVDWVCKEPALVVWNDPNRSDISSLGLPCPTGKPTLLTLWIGRDATKSTLVMLHLRISVRISKRRKTLDHFLLPSSGLSATESCSIVNLEDASDNVRQCLEEAYGKSSTKKYLRVSFDQSNHGRVLMPLVPESAPCLAGTALHLLTLFRSLSHAKSFEIFVGHSSHAQHALMNLENGVSGSGAEVDLPRSYNNGGVFDDWRQIGAGCVNSQGNKMASGREDEQVRNTNVKDVDRTSPEVDGQLICSPPPYSPPVRTIKLPATPQAKASLKRSRLSTTPEANQPSPKSARRGNSLSPPLSNALNVPGNIVRSFSLESTAYSPTIINTPSTVDDTPGIVPTIFTTRHEPSEYHANVDDRVRQLDQEKVLEQVIKSFTSNPGIFDAISPKSVMRALHNELRALVSAQVPLLTENSLQRIIEELLSSLDYTQKVAEVELQEISEDLKTELQIEKDKGIEDIDEHAQDVLSDLKSQMEDLASGHMVAFEDLLQQTSEQLIQTLKGFLSVVAKAVAIGREQEHCSASPSADVVAKSPASIATKLFLNDFKELCTTDKVKVLERLASQNTAEVFLTVDQELRGAWVASWIA